MSRRLPLGLLLCVGLISVHADSPNMYVKVTSGKTLLWRRDAGGWTSVRDSAAVGFSDSLFLDHHEAATLHLGQESQVLLKGLCRLAVGGNELDVALGLVEGQLFLRREKPYQYNTVVVHARGCVLTPIGTAGAVKFTKKGEPSVAMLHGKMRMQAPDGSAVLVEPGQFATYEIGKALSQGRLAASAVAALEQWSGITYDGPPPPQEQTPLESAAGDEAPSPSGSASVTASEAQSGAVSEPAGDETAATTPTAETQPGDSADQAATGTPAPADSVPTAAADSAESSDESSTGEAAQADADSSETEETAQEGKGGKAHGDAGDDEGPRERRKPTLAAGATVATVGDVQWTMLTVGLDVPIWKFGIFFDLEFWIDEKGKFSNKGWEFSKESWYKDLFRKIRYIRFAHEGDPFFFKLGGLSSVSLGYGFVVDRFTNMLHYPDEKLLGLQVEFNDIGPIGITYQGLVGDFYDFGDDGGVMAHRLGFKFFKRTEKPLIEDLLITGLYAVDRNLYAPARSWDYSLDGPWSDRDLDGILDSSVARDIFAQGGQPFTDSIRASLVAADTMYDTVIEHEDQYAGRLNESFRIIGGDAGMPIIKSKLLRLDLYGQAATRIDDISGWGFGIPGLLLKAGPMWAGIEYRHVQGKFEPGFFNTYYLDERLQRYADTILTKVDRLPNVALNGIFGRAGVSIADVLIVSADYQYMGGEDGAKDQRYEGRAEIGRKVIERIPRLSKAELYVHKKNVHEKTLYNDDGSMRFDDFFEPSPFMHWGYRIGFEITKGASLIWHTRHGYRFKGYRLVSDNSISISTAITF